MADFNEYKGCRHKKYKGMCKFLATQRKKVYYKAEMFL